MGLSFGKKLIVLGLRVPFGRYARNITRAKGGRGAAYSHAGWPLVGGLFFGLRSVDVLIVFFPGVTVSQPALVTSGIILR